MDHPPYTIDHVDPHTLPDAELEAVARLFQLMGTELLPEEPPRPLEAILARLRSNAPNQWNARVRARATNGDVVGYVSGGRSLNEPENAHILWCEVQVHPAHRRKGLATALFREFVQACEGQHPELLFMGMTNDRVPTSRTGQSACSTPAVQSAAVRSRVASAASYAMRMSATLCCTSG